MKVVSDLAKILITNNDRIMRVVVRAKRKSLLFQRDLSGFALIPFLYQ